MEGYMFCFCFLFIYSFIFTLWNQLFQNLLDRSSPHLQDWYLLDDQSEISFSIHHGMATICCFYPQA